jgi:hypothetical protein
MMIYSAAVFYWLYYSVSILVMKKARINEMLDFHTRREYLEIYREPPHLSEDELLEIRRFVHTDLLTLSMLLVFPFFLLWGRVFLFAVNVAVLRLLIFGLGALACHFFIRSAGNPYLDIVKGFFDNELSDVWIYPLVIFNPINNLHSGWLKIPGYIIATIVSTILYLILVILLFFLFEILLIVKCLRPYLKTAFLSFPILFALILSTSDLSFFSAFLLAILSSVTVPLIWALFLGVAMVLSLAAAWVYS